MNEPQQERRQPKKNLMRPQAPQDKRGSGACVPKDWANRLSEPEKGKDVETSDVTSKTDKSRKKEEEIMTDQSQQDENWESIQKLFYLNGKDVSSQVQPGGGDLGIDPTQEQPQQDITKNWESIQKLFQIN